MLFSREAEDNSRQEVEDSREERLNSRQAHVNSCEEKNTIVSNRISASAMSLLLPNTYKNPKDIEVNSNNTLDFLISK